MPTSPRAFRWMLICILAMFSLSIPGTSRSANEEYLVNDDAIGEENRIDPVLIRLDGGDYLALWGDNGRGHIDVMGRRLSAELVPLDDPSYINSEQGYFQHRELDASTAGGGRIGVVWTDDRLGAPQVFARVLRSSDASPVAPEIRVSLELGFGPARAPRVATNSSGKSLVVWIADHNQRGHLFGQLVSANGTREGANIDLVPTSTGREQGEPAVASIPDGRWIVAWMETSESGDQNIFYRFLAADGTPTGSVLRANSDLFSDAPQTSPDVMCDGEKILVVWTDGRTSGFDVWGRWFDLEGEPLAPEASLREAPDDPGDLDPRIIRAAGGDFAIQWFGGFANRQRLMARLFDANGEPRTSSFAFDDPNAVVQMRGGRLAPAGNGKFIAAWSDNRTFAFNVYARALDATGQGGAVTTVQSVPRSSSQVYGDIALFPDGRAIAVWSDMQFGALTVFGRFLDEMGRPVGQSFQVSGVPPNASFDTVDFIESIADYSPSVAASADGFVVTWSINQQGGVLNAYGQYFLPDGTPVGGNFRVVPDRIGDSQWSSRPAMLPGGGFVIALQINDGNSGWDVVMQRFAADGLPVGPLIQCADNRTADQLAPDVAVSRFGQVMVTWSDRRNGGWDVYAQRFSSNGDRLGTNEIQHAEDPNYSDQLRPAVAISDDRTITVWETRPNLEGLIEARLEIFPTAAPDGSQSRARSVLNFVVNSEGIAKGAKYPDVAMTPDGHFLVTWWDNSRGHTELLAQRYDPEGTPIGSPYPVHGTGEEGSRLDPHVEVTESMIQFLWSDSRRAKGWDIRTRRVDWDFSGEPSPVWLSQWDASVDAGGVSLQWRTDFESGFSGFHVWRAPAESEAGSAAFPKDVAARLTRDPLGARGTGTYAFVDAAPPAGYVEYWLEAVDRDGSSEFFGPRTVRVQLAASALAWPNPFHDSVRFRLPGVSGDATIQILDITGRLVRDIGAPDASTWIWDGRNADGVVMPAGVYFARPKDPLQRQDTGSSLKLLRVR